MKRSVHIDPHQVRRDVLSIAGWLSDDGAPAPARAALAAAVRGTVRTVAQIAPGNSVEIRVPPFVAVQCIDGPRHTRGTPPNVVETDPRTWLLLAIGELDFAVAVRTGAVSASGSRAVDVGGLLPVLRIAAR